jgi:hypothetical protein
MVLPRIDAQGPRQVAPLEPARPVAPVGDARQEALDRTMSSLIGRTVPVAVLAKMTDGTFLVRVAGNAARMALPEGAQPGTEVPLKVIAGEPRPAFQLTGALLPRTPLTYSPGAAAPLPGSAEMAELPTADLARVAVKGAAPGAASLTPAAAAPGDPKTAPQLSPTGRALGDVLGAALKLPQPTEARIATAPMRGRWGSTAGQSSDRPAPPRRPPPTRKKSPTGCSMPSTSPACFTSRTWPNGPAANARWPN